MSRSELVHGLQLMDLEGEVQSGVGGFGRRPGAAVSPKSRNHAVVSDGANRVRQTASPASAARAKPAPTKNVVDGPANSQSKPASGLATSVARPLTKWK